jgi:hypothetical protein
VAVSDVEHRFVNFTFLKREGAPIEGLAMDEDLAELAGILA